jgi:hypothetical protein
VVIIGVQAVETSNPIKEAVTQSSEKTEPSSKRRKIILPALGALFQLARFLVVLPIIVIRGRRTKAEEVTVYSAHPSFFLWALILAGFVSAAIVRWRPELAGLCGWFYLLTLLYFFATLLYDFSLRKLGLWILIFACIWLLAKYVEHNRDVAIIGSLSRYLASLKPKLDVGTVTILSWLLVLPWCGALLHMALNGRKKFTPNEIGEFHFGEGSELTDRVGLRFRTKYRDVLETILTFGGGDLIAVDNHQNVIKRWDNVIGLYFFWKDLDKVLHQRAVMETLDEDAAPKP